MSVPSFAGRHRVRIAAVVTTAFLVSAVGAGSASADRNAHRHDRWSRANRSFEHVGTFDVRDNGNEVAEIVDKTRDGKTLVYTDSATGSIGFVDIADPSHPKAAGKVELGGEPTSVAVGRKYALVAVDTSDGDFDRPTGTLFVVDAGSREIVKTFPLGGQPDSVALSPDGRYAAIVLENQRDEDENGGLLPQPPPGQLVVIETKGDPNWWPLRYVDFTGLAMLYPTDPEPEFVDINDKNLAVVSFQENNHLAVVDVKTGRIVNDFSAGEVTLENVDVTEEELGPQGNGVITLDGTITKRREPDTVGWIDRDTFATANEGDYEDTDGVEGGSRSFTLFNIDGTVEYEAGTAFEYASIRAGHYNEGRSENKGGEPEALEVGEFGADELLFVGSERANVIGVYDVEHGDPTLLQMLPSGIGPEGIKAIEKRNLFVVAAETSVDGDLPADERVIPSMITIYQRLKGAPAYTQLMSGNDANGLPIPWVAQSGLAGDPVDPDVLWSVSDSILAAGTIYRIDVSDEPAMITDAIVVTENGEIRRDLDLEGIAVAPEGGFWLASEGRNNSSSGRPNSLLRVDDAGVVQDEVFLPEALLAAGWSSSGFEGVAASGDGTTQYLYAVIQREWASDAPGFVKIGRYDVADGSWTFVSYGLDAVPASPPAIDPWVGLSEISLLPDGTFAIIERDNQLGPLAQIKRVYRVDLATAPFKPFGDELEVVTKTLLADLLGELTDTSVWTPDKLEGLGVTKDGDVYVVTDNDGLDDAIGQTVFLEVELG